MPIKKYIVLALLFFAALLLPKTIVRVQNALQERHPDIFSLEKLALNIEGDFPAYELPDLTHIANQKYHYIGHGGQAVAFASADDLYVLKFFVRRAIHGPKKFLLPKPTHWIPSHREKKAKSREAKRMRCLSKAMTNYSLAFEKMKEKTGLIALHLLPTQEALPKVRLIDMYGKEHVVELERASFVLQKKAVLVKDKLSSLSDEGKKQALASLASFFEERAKLGCTDIERSFMIEANYGFLGDQPIQIDVGNIEFLDKIKKAPQSEIRRMQKLLTNWVKDQ